MRGAPSTTTTTTTAAATSTSAAAPLRWEYDGTAWHIPGREGNEPDCNVITSLPAPSDLSKATAVLYPGQVRGGDYKPHGGFRFDGAATTDVQLVAPIDGAMVRASRYLEEGDVQHLIEIVNPCGYMVRFDHILTPSPAMQAVFDALPAPQPDDSRTTNIDPPVEVAVGDVLADAVGHEGNVSYDFGVYDLRQPNGSDAPPGELSSFAICWLDLVPGAKLLPPGDQQAGTTSDYCS